MNLAFLLPGGVRYDGPEPLAHVLGDLLRAGVEPAEARRLLDVVERLWRGPGAPGGLRACTRRVLEAWRERQRR